LLTNFNFILIPTVEMLQKEIQSLCNFSILKIIKKLSLQTRFKVFYRKRCLENYLKKFFVLPRLPSNEKNSSDHHNSLYKGPNLAFFSFIENPSNSLPTIKYPKNHITSSYHSNMSQIAKAKIWPLRTLGVKHYFC
jgi:hypothetical protein